ncbi:MAG TPA: rRNA maturation RNase YbeY [Chitinophagaceae bacterium]|nr:rRNA maturation RNase YbeY [Chitinophagaceae bacterium]
MSSSSKSKIYFFFQAPVSLRQRSKLKNYIESIFKKEGKEIQTLNYIFCTDNQLLEINRQYLNHDYYTDIISFGLSPKESPINGEIYISIDRVKDNARLLNEPFYLELHRVIFHGALHLCGYRDKRKKEILEMRKMETKYLEGYL